MEPESSGSRAADFHVVARKLERHESDAALDAALDAAQDHLAMLASRGAFIDYVCDRSHNYTNTDLLRETLVLAMSTPEGRERIALMSVLRARAEYDLRIESMTTPSGYVIARAELFLGGIPKEERHLDIYQMLESLYHNLIALRAVCAL